MASPRYLDSDVDCLGAACARRLVIAFGNCDRSKKFIRITEGCSLIECRMRWCSRTVCLALLLAIAGCGRENTEPREAFQNTRAWQVEGEQPALQVSAKLQPLPLKAERPAMLEVRLKAANGEKPFAGRIWYRFAHRRGDPLPAQKDLAVRPTFTYEEGTPPRYQDWFEWAEILEPRFEHGESVFTTPVMMIEGKSYVQFQIASEADSKPIELLDWFVYVDKPE